MRAGLRLGMAMAAAGLWFAQTPALAQGTPAATSNTTSTPATDSVGPRELQNFNLQGTVSRPAEPAPAPRPRASSVTPAEAAPAAEKPRPGLAGASFTVSIGIAVQDHTAAGFERMYREADAALYLAKSRGKHRFAYFDV